MEEHPDDNVQLPLNCKRQHNREFIQRKRQNRRWKRSNQTTARRAFLQHQHPSKGMQSDHTQASSNFSTPTTLNIHKRTQSYPVLRAICKRRKGAVSTRRNKNTEEPEKTEDMDVDGKVVGTTEVIAEIMEVMSETTKVPGAMEVAAEIVEVMVGNSEVLARTTEVMDGITEVVEKEETRGKEEKEGTEKKKTKRKCRRQRRQQDWRNLRDTIIEHLPTLNPHNFVFEDNPNSVFVRRPFQRKSSSEILTAEVLKESIDGKKARVFEDGVTLIVRQGQDLVLGLSATVQPVDIMAAAQAGGIALKEIARFHLPQCRHTTHEEGWVGGIGYRKGYAAHEEKEPYGLYRTKETSKQDDVLYEEYYGNIMVLVEALEAYCAVTYPTVYQERASYLTKQELDAITVVSPHAIFSHNFRGAPHFDADIGYALGLWLLHHEENCPFKDERCAPHWYFYLPQYHIAVKLRHGTVIAWDSRNVAHCTIHDQVFPGCQVTAICIVTQIQKDYAKAVWRVKGKGTEP